MSRHRIDINEKAIVTADDMARIERLDSLVRFSQCDASNPLPFDSMTFNAVTCIDSVNHLRDRLQFIKESYRVLKPGGRLLFTDPITVTGLISNDEVAVRSSTGFFLFSPPGEGERLIKASGFELLIREDVTENTAQISKRRLNSREKHSQDLPELKEKKHSTEPSGSYQWFTPSQAKDDFRELHSSAREREGTLKRPKSSPSLD